MKKRITLRELNFLIEVAKNDSLKKFKFKDVLRMERLITLAFIIQLSILIWLFWLFIL